MSFMDTLRSRAKIVKEWTAWTPKIAEAAKKNLPEAEVYAFGSIVRGDNTGGSDIDILVVSEKVPKKALKRAELKVKMEDAAKLPLPHPFEIHLVTPEEADRYLRKAGKDRVKL